MNASPLPPYVHEAYLKSYTQDALEVFAEVMGSEVGDIEKRIIQNEQAAGLRVELSALRTQVIELRDVIDRHSKRGQKRAL